MYALHILSQYEFFQHPLRYAKYSKADRLMFRIYDGPKVIKTMTDLMQFLFQCNADIGGNLDNKHLQTNCLGYLAGIFIRWCSTDQGNLSCQSLVSEPNEFL